MTIECHYRLRVNVDGVNGIIYAMFAWPTSSSARMHSSSQAWFPGRRSAALKKQSNTVRHSSGETGYTVVVLSQLPLHCQAPSPH